MGHLPALERHQGEETWVNQEMDALRETESLCANCANLNAGRDNCPLADSLADLAAEGNMAFLVTRCREFRPDR